MTKEMALKIQGFEDRFTKTKNQPFTTFRTDQGTMNCFDKSTIESIKKHMDSVLKLEVNIKKGDGDKVFYNIVNMIEILATETMRFDENSTTTRSYPPITAEKIKTANMAEVTQMKPGDTKINYQVPIFDARKDKIAGVAMRYAVDMHIADNRVDLPEMARNIAKDMIKLAGEL